MISATILFRYLLLLLSIFPLQLLAQSEIRQRVLQVGPDKEFLYPSIAAQFARDGDVIEIDAKAKYHNDHVIWKQNNLTIRGVNGRPHIRSSGLIPNKKGIWVIQGDNTTVSNIEFSGARVADKNGAAIRLEGRNFTLKDCYIHDNENGILSGIEQESSILIDTCEFAFNGYGGRGLTHNIYIGRITNFTLKNSYSHHAIIGHLVKSRAKNNYILYNRLFEGNSSYSIDLSNGGYALIMGNIFYQGPNTENYSLITFGPEGYKHKFNRMEIAYNTFLNERKSGIFIKVNRGGKASIANNLFVGNGVIASGEASTNNNIHERNMFKRFSGTGYQVIPEKLSLIVDKGRSINTNNETTSRIPEFQFKRGKLERRKILGSAFDIGAIEFK